MIHGSISAVVDYTSAVLVSVLLYSIKRWHISRIS